MADPAYQRRFLRQADADPAAVNEYAKSVLGHDLATAERLLAIHRSLVDGKKIDSVQHEQLRAAHPNVPIRQLAAIVSNLNQQPPGQRADLYVALLAGDSKAVTGNFAEAGETFKQLQAFTRSYHTEAAAEQINAKRETTTDPEVAKRVIERPAEDAMSTRALLAAQFEGQHGKDARTIAEAADQGHPQAEAYVRENLAQTIERSSEKLAPDADVSTRDTVAAAFDFHEAEAVAEDQGYVSQEQT